MTLIYPYTVDDVSTNALRSDWNPTQAYLSRTPQRGNSGNHPEIVNGWCGTTNDTDVYALGEIDTDNKHPPPENHHLGKRWLRRGNQRQGRVFFLTWSRA